MGAKRPQPPPDDQQRYDADRPTSPPPPPKKKDGLSPSVEKALGVFQGARQLTAERDDLRRQLDEANAKVRRLRTAIAETMLGLRSTETKELRGDLYHYLANILIADCGEEGGGDG